MQALQHDRKSAVNRRGKNDKLDERLKRLARKHSFDPQVRGANAKHVLPKPRSSKAKGKDGDGAPNSRGHRCVCRAQDARPVGGCLCCDVRQPRCTTALRRRSHSNKAMTPTSYRPFLADAGKDVSLTKLMESVRCSLGSTHPPSPRTCRR